MKVEQFVMAYRVEQDRIRAMLSPGFVSLRPVLRINAEIIDDSSVYVELNTPVMYTDVCGWVNIANWGSEKDGLSFTREGKTVHITAPFLSITYTGVGVEGGCPAEETHRGCFYPSEDGYFLTSEKITAKKEFCDCEFAWHFHDGDAHGVSIGKTLPAVSEPETTSYAQQELTAENAASIPCQQVLGSYIVRFEREKPGKRFETNTDKRILPKVYGSPLCPDCRECRANLDANGVKYKYIDITASMKALKEFLALRDKLPEFIPAKESGAVGIPAILAEDGAVTLDWEGWLAECGLPVVYKEKGPVCSINGKGC